MENYYSFKLVDTIFMPKTLSRSIMHICKPILCWKFVIIMIYNCVNLNIAYIRIDWDCVYFTIRRQSIKICWLDKYAEQNIFVKRLKKIFTVSAGELPKYINGIKARQLCRYWLNFGWNSLCLLIKYLSSCARNKKHWIDNIIFK